MQIGKIPNDILKQIVLDKIKKSRMEVLIGPSIGEDCCALDFGEFACIMSSDPITGTASEIGRLAVHISCNDLASCGAEPVGLLVTVLAPPGSTENELEKIMDQLTQTAALLNVDIIGGHTEITSSVTRFVINSTAVGKVLKSRIVTTGGAKPGDFVVLTKTAGLEGSAIIAFDKEKELRGILNGESLEEAKGFMNNISVVKEGLIAGAFGVSAMHDATEGGVLGAVWEICEASGTGVELNKKQIPVAMSTLMICEYYNINPLKLISSGCMLIVCSDGEGLVKKLKDHNIPAAVIGIINKGSDRHLISDGKSEPILPPGPDDLFKVIK
jgi:hydrogenase expression/formation protein HypE